MFKRRKNLSTNVHVTDVEELVRAGALLVDVRERGEWDAGHAPDAVHAPLKALVAAGRSSLPAADAYLFICRSGNRSGQALKAIGLADADKNVSGGMKAWSAAGLAMVAESNKRPVVA